MNHKSTGIIDMTGKRFGKLVVTGYSHTINKRVYWNCICDCGNTCAIHGTKLRNGHTKSCGCIKKEACRKRKINKPHYKKIYQVWSNMKNRCKNPNNCKYKYYGEKGISICDEWKDFGVFYEWCINSGYSENLTIDRIDSGGNYEPSNCRWITLEDQQRNKCSNVYISCNGETKTITDWSRTLGVTRHSIRYWITKYNGDAEMAIRHYLERNEADAVHQSKIHER